MRPVVCVNIHYFLLDTNFCWLCDCAKPWNQIINRSTIVDISTKFHINDISFWQIHKILCLQKLRKPNICWVSFMRVTILWWLYHAFSSACSIAINCSFKYQSIVKRWPWNSLTLDQVHRITPVHFSALNFCKSGLNCWITWPLIDNQEVTHSR